MVSDAESPKPKTIRHKCSACYKQYKKKEHLIEHMKDAFHSVHDPSCGLCKKHCKSFESLREHLTGKLAKENCKKIFSEQGCDLCLKLFDSDTSLSQHREMCLLSAPASIGTMVISCAEPKSDTNSSGGNLFCSHPEAIAMDCEMVGGGSDGSLDLCARVCLTDEEENILFHTYVRPQISVTNYRYEITGLTEQHLKNAMPLKEVQDKVLQTLRNAESIGSSWAEGGNTKLLVGHDLEHDLDCMEMYYPHHLLRDTAKYPPLMKTNLVSHSLKYLTQTYLGYNIQSGTHDPYEDCVSAMRLYKRFRALDHQMESIGASLGTHYAGETFESLTTDKLEKMTPDELYEISRSKYKCWCLDVKPATQP